MQQPKSCHTDTRMLHVFFGMAGFQLERMGLCNCGESGNKKHQDHNSHMIAGQQRQKMKQWF